MMKKMVVHLGGEFETVGTDSVDHVVTDVVLDNPCRSVIADADQIRDEPAPVGGTECRQGVRSQSLVGRPSVRLPGVFGQRRQQESGSGVSPGEQLLGGDLVEGDSLDQPVHAYGASNGRTGQLPSGVG